MDNLAVVLGVFAYVFAIAIGILLVFAPLFIWHHVAKLRKEFQDGISSVMNELSVQVKELRAINGNVVEMQRRYVKTMQYVCDRLADICDHTGVVEHKTEEAQ